MVVIVLKKSRFLTQSWKSPELSRGPEIKTDKNILKSRKSAEEVLKVLKVYISTSENVVGFFF